MSSAVGVLPALWPVLTGVATWLLPPRPARALAVITALGLLAMVPVAPGLAGVHGHDLTLWFLLPSLVLSATGLLVSLSETRDAPDRGRRYFFLYELFCAAILFVVLAPDLLVLWGAVEATTLASVFLVACPATPGAVSAAWRYLVVTSVGGLSALAGIVVVSAGAHVSLAVLTAHPGPRPDLAVVLTGLAFVTVGFGTKAGLAPMHTWLPDAHGEAPAPVSALLSGIELGVALYGLMRVMRLVAAVAGPLWPQRMLVVLGILSLVAAALFAGRQRDMKRLLAYSSIEHLGLMSLGLGLGGVAAVGALLLVWTHGAGKTLLFYAAGNVKRRYHATAAPSVRGLMRAVPWTATALVVGALAIGGMPPFGPFFSEWLIFTGGFHRFGPLPAMAAVGLVAAVVVGFGRHLPRMVMGEGTKAVERERLGEVVPLVVMAVVVLVGGVAIPYYLHHLLFAAARSADLGVVP